jgi:hypothetical protein
MKNKFLYPSIFTLYLESFHILKNKKNKDIYEEITF